MTINSKELKRETGNRLFSLRVKHGFTREALIDKLQSTFQIDIDEKTIRRYESGAYLPRTDILIVLSELFGVSLDYLIFGKETSDDNVYTWEASLKRLNRLIFSCILIPSKEENKNSPFYGKYFFTAYDEEVRVYMDRLMSFSESTNYGFEVREESPYFDISTWDKLIDNFSTYPDDLSPSMERMNNVLKNALEDPEAFQKQRIESILKKRKK